MKKFFALLLALVMSLSLFACGSKSGGAKTMWQRSFSEISCR